MKFINRFFLALNKWPSLNKCCIRAVFILLKLRPEPAAPNAFSSELSVSQHTHTHTHTQRRVNSALPTQEFILTQLMHYQLIPGNSKQPGLRPCSHVLLVIRSHTFVFLHLFVSVTEQVSCFTAKGAWPSRFLPAPCQPATPRRYFGTPGC